ncbi:MAG: FxLYD domain-containing protein [Acidimicrobiales bacterium]
MSASPRAASIVALACAAILSVAGCASSGKEVSTASGGDGTKSTTTTAKATEVDDPVEDDETTTTEAEASAGPAIEVAETGFSTYQGYDDSTQATAGAVLENTGDSAALYFEVVFSFKDASGKPVGTETDTVYAVGPGEIGYAEVQMVDLTGEPATVEASAVVDDESFFDATSLAITVEGVSPEDYGDGVEVNGIASNETDTIYEYFTVSCVLRAGGKIVGGAQGSLDTLVPGGSITWTASGPVPADAAECAASGSL